jgi:hypothetical protein
MSLNCDETGTEKESFIFFNTAVIFFKGRFIDGLLWG